jgi:hypothetical protein
MEAPGMITIDKGVAKPAPRPSRYPFDLLEVGDSFLALPADAPQGEVNSARNMCIYYGKKLQRKFSSHLTPEGLRIWRDS